MIFEYLYVFFVAFGLCVTYFFLTFGLARFFEWENPSFSLRVVSKSFAQIFFGAALVFVAMHLTDDRQLANRIEHAFGGGFLALYMCFLVARNSTRSITRFQFFVLAFLTVTALGVANEILEFIAQNYFGLHFVRHVNDTWLDLISNTVGALLGAAVFVPLLKAKRPSDGAF